MRLLFPILLVAMYMLLIRPQQQRVRAQRALVASLQVGDEVVTAGGVVARIVELTDEDAYLEVAPGVVVRFVRPAVSRKLTPNPEPDEPEEAAEADQADEEDSTGGDDRV